MDLCILLNIYRKVFPLFCVIEQNQPEQHKHILPIHLQSTVNQPGTVPRALGYSTAGEGMVEKEQKRNDGGEPSKGVVEKEG